MQKKVTANPTDVLGRPYSEDEEARKTVIMVLPSERFTLTVAGRCLAMASGGHGVQH